MRYFSEILDDKTGYIYSCDMVRFSIEVRKDCAEKFACRFSADTRLDVNVYPVSYVRYKYRQMISVNVGESTVVMGIGFNGDNVVDDRLRGYIEFNPNKCFPEWKAEFIDICGWCNKVEIARVDLAVDIPVDRCNCSLVKDVRLYEYQQKASDDYTEYLGKRNTVGRVKLYNKSKEQKLKYPLTRLEITTECDIKEFKKHIPQVIVSDVEQIDFERADLSGLSQNDRVTVSLLNILDFNTRMEWLQKYTYRHRQKISKYVMADTRLELNCDCVQNVFRWVQSYANLC